MVKIALPVNEGLPCETKGQLQRFLADQGLLHVTFRRRDALLERWSLTGFDQANCQYHFTVIRDQYRFWLLGYPPIGGSGTPDRRRVNFEPALILQ